MALGGLGWLLALALASSRSALAELASAMRALGEEASAGLVLEPLSAQE